MSFHGLIACYFLELNNIPLSEYNMVCLSVYLLKDIWFASQFSHLYKYSCCRHLCADFCVDIKFSTRLGKEIPRSLIGGLYGGSMFSF